MKLTNTDDSSTLTLTPAELRALVLVTTKDPGRINLRGILLDANDRIAASTDGHRLIVYDIPKHGVGGEDKPCDEEPKPGRSVLVDRGLAELALKTAKKDEDIHIRWGAPSKAPPPKKKPDAKKAEPLTVVDAPPEQFFASDITISIGAAVLSGKGLNIRFPPYRAVLPTRPASFAHTLSCNATYFSEACDAFTSILGKRKDMIELWMGADSLSPIIIQALDDMKGRWRYVLMPMRGDSNEPWAPEPTTLAEQVERATPTISEPMPHIDAPPGTVPSVHPVAPKGYLKKPAKKTARAPAKKKPAKKTARAPAKKKPAKKTAPRGARHKRKAAKRSR